MRYLHHAWVTVYVKPEDDPNKVRDALLKFFPFELSAEKLKIVETPASIDETREFTILQVHLEKAHHLNAFLKHLLSLLTSEQKEVLLKQKESRLDSGIHFFIRFDKPNLLETGEYFLTDSGNCFHIKLALAAYPANRKAGLALIDSLLSKGFKSEEHP